MAISKWIGSILILVAFIIAGKAQATDVPNSADFLQISTISQIVKL